MSKGLIFLPNQSRDSKPAVKRATNEEICHTILKFLMEKKKRGQTWVPIEELYKLDPKPPRVYRMLNYMNEKLVVIDRSRVQRVVALFSKSLEDVVKRQKTNIS